MIGMMAKIIILATIILFLTSSISAAKNGCKSPQYLEVGKNGTIVCYFEEGFSSIHWYFNADIKADDPTVSYEDQVVKGEGYASGEFNIRRDGSLIVNTVSVQHEAIFTVVEVKTVQELPKEYSINIVTIIRPTPAHPVVNDCEVNHSTCYIQWKQQTSIVCRIHESRPMISLKWVARTVQGDINVTNETIFTSQANTWTSSLSVTDPFIYSSYLALLICKAGDQFKLLEQNESAVLIHNKDKDSSLLESTEVSVERNDDIHLSCSDSDYELLVWERISPSDKATTVVFHVANIGEIFIASNEYELDEGELVITNVNIHHEGIYRCTHSDEINEGGNSVNLTVYVTPVPEYPVIEGCTHKQYCVIETKYNGRLTCTVNGIRPVVNLEWRAYHETSSKTISFHKQQLNIISNGDTSDVTLTMDYIAQETINNKITVECRAIGPNAKYFHLSSKIDLLFPGSIDRRTTDKTVTEEGITQQPLSAAVIIIAIIALIILLIAVAVILLYTVRRKRTNHIPPSLQDEENLPLNPSKEKLKGFISQLQSTYENLYSAVKPIPFFQGNCSVHDLYVESGIEYFQKSKSMKNKWVHFDSYKNIFTDHKISGDRWIIEGEPGFGKSTLSLLLTYEWCRMIHGSFMKDVEIFILIRLRQLGGVSSIYEAIKRFILPKDSKFTIDDIKGFIDNSSSVLIILDGFDEYPDRDSGIDTDVFNILKRTMLPECRVLLTTRSSQMPKDYAAQTNRLRLMGFKAKAQEEYVQKVVAVNGHTSTDNIIKEWLEENPVLCDLCEVPLFFVMYAHLSLDNDTLKNCTSVTSFFRYMITCLHSHLKLKFKDENVDNFKHNENIHQALDELCFESLNGHSYNPSIEKDVFIEKLGKKQLDQFLSIGILREEEVIIEVSNKPWIQATDHVREITKVRFYHSLFCEWYAAHHVARILDNIDTIPGQSNVDDPLVILEDLDQSQLQYVYRFACGINENAAKHILNYLKMGEGNTKFSILCILEQRGNVGAIIDHVRELCSETVQIRSHDTRIKQRSVIQLMEIAVDNKIPIPKLQLIECFKEMDQGQKEIILKSEVRLPLLNDIGKLWIEQTGTKFIQKQLIDIFNYISQCKHLREIRFVNSLLPFSFKDDKTLELLLSKEIKVLWYPSEVWYYLDLQSGNWQHKTGFSQLTKDDYDKVVAVFDEINI